LGLGVVPPEPSWGLMIRGARAYMSYSALGLIWPCLALVTTVLIFNLLCDRLRDVFDPKSQLAQRRPDSVPAHARPVADDALLQVDNLHTHIQTARGLIRAVDGVSFSLRPGEILAVVGESGSGKSMTGLSVMGLTPGPAGRVVGGQAWFRTKGGTLVDLANTDDELLRRICGDEIAMIFQEPMSALNPVYRIGTQIVEGAMHHRGMSRNEAWALAIEMLDKVGVPEPALRARAYPHELSGGLRQRAMIAMALALQPRLLIADEPTTALDVTIQAQILELLRNILADSVPKPAMIFITHDLGVVSELADRISVFYAGRVVEEGPVDEIFANPAHPYTRGLLESAPQPGSHGRLREIEGTVPNPLDLPAGCAFAPRCPHSKEQCQIEMPALEAIAAGRATRCWLWRDLA